MSEDEPSEEEDWFERALRDTDADPDDWEEFDGDEGDWAEFADENAAGAETGDDGDDTFGTSSDDTAGADAGMEGTDDVPADWTQTVETDADARTFAAEFAGSETGAGEAGGVQGTRPAEEGVFDEEFSDAFGGDEGDFADEEFESDIPRVDVGIQGLDDMIQGGIPRKHLIVVIGGAGTGKTTFGLQFLHHGLQTDESAVFITLEQSYEDIMATANERNWDFEGYEDEGRLAIVDLDPVEMANSLDNIQAELPALIRDFGADRLVLDSVSLLEMMYDDQAKRRTEVFDFTRSLKEAGVTTFLTSEASESNPYASRHGIIEYLTDAVFVLQYVRGQSQETRLAVEILKIRNANHSREQKPYEMTEDGISVYQQASIF